MKKEKGEEYMEAEERGGERRETGDSRTTNWNIFDSQSRRVQTSARL